VGICRCRLGRPPFAGVALARRWPLSSVLRWWQPEEVFSADETVGASCGRTPDSLALMACPHPSSVDAGEGLVTAASTLRSSLLLFSRLKRGSLSLLSERLPVSRLEFVIPRAPWYGGCSYPPERNRSPVCNGTLSASVCSLWLSRPEHLGIRERSYVSSSSRALGLVCWLAEPLNRASVAFHRR
jgi:hypothetical protein